MKMSILLKYKSFRRHGEYRCALEPKNHSPKKVSNTALDKAKKEMKEKNTGHDLSRWPNCCIRRAVSSAEYPKNTGPLNVMCAGRDLVSVLVAGSSGLTP